MLDLHPSRLIGRASATTAWLLGFAAACVGALVVTNRLALHTTRGRLLDGASLRGATDARSGVTDVVESLLDVVTVVSLLTALVVLVLIALARLRRDLALAAAAVVIGANVTTQVLKRYVFERPDFGLYESTPSTLNSMPSGHSTVAYSLVVAAVLVLPVALRPFVAAVGVAYAALAGVATLSAGWHRPSDTVAAFLVVGAWAGVVGAVLDLDRGGVGGAESADDETSTAVDRAHRTAARRFALAAAYLLAFGALLAGIVVLTQLDTYGTAAQWLSYAAGAGAISGTGAVLMAGLLALVHRVTRRPRVARSEPAEPG